MIDSSNINFTSFSDNGSTIDTTTQFDFPSADLPVILAGTYEGYNYYQTFQVLGDWTNCNGCYCGAILNPIFGTFTCDYTPIPEPGSAFMLTSMAGLLGWVSRRRRV